MSDHQPEPKDTPIAATTANALSTINKVLKGLVLLWLVFHVATLTLRLTIWIEPSIDSADSTNMTVLAADIVSSMVSLIMLVIMVVLYVKTVKLEDLLDSRA